MDAPFVFHVSNVSAVEFNPSGVFPNRPPVTTAFPGPGLHPPVAFPSVQTRLKSPGSEPSYFVPVLVLSSVLAIVICALIFWRRKGFRGFARWRARAPRAALDAPAGEEDWLHDWPPAAFRFDPQILGQRVNRKGLGCENHVETAAENVLGSREVGLEPYLERTRREWAGPSFARLDGHFGGWSSFVAVEKVDAPREPSQEEESFTLREAFPRASSFRRP